MTLSKAPRVFPVQNGFALVVTLSLMILLTVIAVGLLTLSSISLRSSSQGNASSAARANARLALVMALGELQKEMGPDSRISASHNAGSTATGGQPRWTAVYDAWQRPVDAATPESPASRNLVFRKWLVSGANLATGGPAGIGETVNLVGKKSLIATALPEDQISVPLHGMSVGNFQGRIGWWISDESTKAKVNAGPNTDLASKPLGDAQSPPHVGSKAVPALEKFDWMPGQRSSAVSTGSVNLAAGLGPLGIGNLSHDITVHSAGVLSDVRSGRLKRDLTNLLARPIAELENKPLFLVDGRMNRFAITEDGKVSNATFIPGTNGTGANRWGINLEELHLFHQLHREVDWSTGKPQLVNKSSTEAMVQDRFFLYRKPTMEAQNIILSFVAEADTAPGTYRIAAMMDAMVATSNPNDIPIVWPAGVLFRMDMEGFPYRPQWNIRKADNSVRHSHTVQAINYPFFKSSISGGFTLEPGEAAVFGASTTDTSSESVNLTRGYVPRGGVRIAEKRWSTDTVYDPTVDGLRATGLLPDDTMDFTMIPAPTSNGSTPSGWISCYAKVKNASGGADIGISTHRLAGGGGSVLTKAPINRYMQNSIRPSTRPQIRDFIGSPMPVLMTTTMPNVEKSRTDLLPPNAFPSRPYHFYEPATNTMIVSTTTPENTDLTMQNSQLVTIAEPMNYEFGGDRTMPTSGGRNLPHGAARDTTLGGSLTVIKRRIPLAAPLSLGAFENAIACGMTQRFATPGALNGNANGLPAMAKLIGNSWSNPFLSSTAIADGTYHDPSWMANTALWDSWFLSGMVADPASSASWGAEPRSPRTQFRELAANTGKLRNKRFIYNLNSSIDVAEAELFSGDSFKPAAINKLSKYLLLDGAFNVNSTSEQAWKAMLSSVRDQELFVKGGAKQKFKHPFGTLGYAEKISPTDDWAGLRDLSESEIDGLSKAIVAEVKARGPFLSVADFVNRRPNGSDPVHQALGALQAAIDKAGLNSRFNDPNRRVIATDLKLLAGANVVSSEPTPARAIGSAGYLSQAALLSSLGSQITVRGDTFLIRAYGDHRDKTGTVLAKSWCEAVVQRVPEYVDASNAPDTLDALTPVNTAFGRKLKIISFRWLNPQEI
jgi:Tfp pilus assembly protein PilX